jgi:hypothetical protein
MGSAQYYVKEVIREAVLSSEGACQDEEQSDFPANGKKK